MPFNLLFTINTETKLQQQSIFSSPSLENKSLEYNNSPAVLTIDRAFDTRL